jgi:hypothetical protein
MTARRKSSDRMPLWRRALRPATLCACATMVASCDPPTKQCAPATLQPLAQLPSYGVVLSDYIASAVGLLNGDGEFIIEAWVDTGSTPAGVSTALSGDVALPSTALQPDVLTYLDRYGVDVVTRVAVPQGTVLSQTHVQLPPDQSLAAFRSNPHDAVLVDEHTMLVTRHEPNGNPNSPELDLGDDLVRIDLATNTIESRVDLQALRTTVDGVTVYARPDRLARLPPWLVIGASRLSKNFRIAAPGAIALYDLRPSATDRVVRVDLEELTNCGEVVVLDATSHTVAALCAGITFGNNLARRANAGIVVVQIEDGRATIQSTWRSAEHPSAPVPRQGLVAVDANHVFVVASGDDETQPFDEGLVITLPSGEARSVVRSSSSFVLGEGVWNSSQELLLLPDTEQGIRRIHITASNVQELPAVPIPCRNLPARQIRPLDTQTP